MSKDTSTFLSVTTEANSFLTCPQGSARYWMAVDNTVLEVLTVTNAKAEKYAKLKSQSLVIPPDTIPRKLFNQFRQSSP